LDSYTCAALMRPAAEPAWRRFHRRNCSERAGSRLRSCVAKSRTQDCNRPCGRESAPYSIRRMLVEKGDAAHGAHSASTALDNAQQSLEPHDATARALFHEAKQQHHAGRIAEAAQLYHRVLSIE